MRKTIAPRPPSFASLVQQFFTEYLVAQRAVSPRTVACYRDALMLFLDFAGPKLGKVPTAIRLADIHSELILAFLDHLEHGRNIIGVRVVDVVLDCVPACTCGARDASSDQCRCGSPPSSRSALGYG